MKTLHENLVALANRPEIRARTAAAKQRAVDVAEAGGSRAFVAAAKIESDAAKSGGLGQRVPK